MHHILPIRGLFLDDQIAVPIKSLQDIQRCILPRLIEWFNPQYGRMSAVPVNNFAQYLQRMLYIRGINGGVGCGERIKGPDPFRRPDRPMFKGRVVDVFGRQCRRPGKSHGLSGIVKTILTPHGRMHVDEYGNPVGVGPIQDLVDIVQSPVDTVRIGPVGYELEITHGQSHRIDGPTIGQLLYNFFRHPRLPVSTQLSIRFGGSQDTAKGVHIVSDTFGGLI